MAKWVLFPVGVRLNPAPGGPLKTDTAKCASLSCDGTAGPRKRTAEKAGSFAQGFCCSLSPRQF